MFSNTFNSGCKITAIPIFLQSLFLGIFFLNFSSPLIIFGYCPKMPIFILLKLSNRMLLIRLEHEQSIIFAVENI